MRKVLSAAVRLLAPGCPVLSSADDRASKRYRLAAWNSLSNALSAATGMVSLFVIVSLTLPTLQAERFGVWMSVASLANMLMFLDLGVGNGLVNLVVKARAVESAQRLRQIVTRGLLLLAAVGLIVGLVLTALTRLLPLDRVIQVGSIALQDETRRTADTFIWLFAIGMPLFGVQRVFFGLQQAWIVHATRAIGHLLSPVLVYLLVQHEASIPWLLLATYGTQTLLPLALLRPLRRRLRTAPVEDVPVSIDTSARQDLRRLLGISGVFLALQIGGAIGWGSDTLIAASVVGAASVAPLVLVQRLFQVVTVPLAIVNTPLWAAYADAHARGDAGFLRRTLRRSLAWTLVTATVASAALILLSDRLFALWLGPGQVVPARLVVWYGIWAVFEAMGHCISMYLNGRNHLRFQLIVVVAFCAVALPLKFWLPSAYGVDSIIAATLLAYLPCVLLPYALFLRRDLRSASAALPHAPQMP